MGSEGGLRGWEGGVEGAPQLKIHCDLVAGRTYRGAGFKQGRRNANVRNGAGACPSTAINVKSMKVGVRYHFRGR